MLTLPCLAPRVSPGRRSWLISGCRGCARPPSREAASSYGGWRPPGATAAPAPAPASLPTRASYSNCHVLFRIFFIVFRYFLSHCSRPPLRVASQPACARLQSSTFPVRRRHGSIAARTGQMRRAALVTHRLS